MIAHASMFYCCRSVVESERQGARGRKNERCQPGSPRIRATMATHKGDDDDGYTYTTRMHAHTHTRVLRIVRYQTQDHVA